ncbi:MAG: hypothetical protein IJU23_12335 [Proteobacteria bacterium]|nr:hypothetical protein [Pseudomonadota bacterium]
MKKAASILGIITLLTGLPTFAQEAEEALDSAAMLSEASEGVVHVQGIVQDAQEAFEEARNDNDVTRMDCINALLVNARGFLSVVKNGESNLQDAVSRNDSESMQHHYKLVQLGVSKGNEVSARLSECSSGAIGVYGTTVLKTTRECAIEPCLDGEIYYEPSKTDILGNMDYIDGDEIDADASAFL